MQILTPAMLRGCGIADSDAVLAALSGGADSTALLIALCELRREGAVGTVYAAHFHHGIRGPEADADARFCEALCAEYGVMLTLARGDAVEYAATHGQSLETAARTLRYAFLHRAMRSVGASCIVTAHHEGDQAETVLMHLLRGCGTSGLVGMRARTGDVARPLLSVSRAAIEAFLRERGASWRTDPSNAEEIATRNRVRHTLLPLLDTFRPNAARAIADTARLVAVDEAYLCALADAAARPLAVDGGYRREGLDALPEPLCARIIRALLLRSADDVTQADIARVRALLKARTGTRIELSGGRHAWVDATGVYVGAYPRREAYSVPFVKYGVTELPCGTIVSEAAERWHKPRHSGELFLDADALPEGLVVRTRRDGDRFFPLGAPGGRKLSDVLTDKKIPLAERDMPLLAAGSEIYCVFGLTIHDRAAVTPDTQHILHIEYKGDEEA